MKKNFSHGFTLIEIIVSVSVILLLSGLFIAGYNRFNDSQKVQQAAATLIRNLQAARTKAAFGTKPAGCDTLIGYIVKFPNSSTYRAQAVCQVGENLEVTTYTLPADVTFNPVPGSVTFYALDRGASVNQTISLTGFGTTMKVSVFASGVVSDFVPTPTPPYIPL
jgi:prepilin-type N-terminal cleavage/methylation domain-containing protein